MRYVEDALLQNARLEETLPLHSGYLDALRSRKREDDA